MNSISYPCFPHTNVPLACLFIHLLQGYTLLQFLQDFPTVTEEQVDLALEIASELFKAPEMAEVFIQRATEEE